MHRYIRKFGRVGLSLGPSEERRFEMWVGYELPFPPQELESRGFVCVDEWPAEKLVEYEIDSFTPVSATNIALQRSLGIDSLFQNEREKK
jgi:hypothetical protein